MKYEGLKVIEERVKVSVETILKPLFEIIENQLSEYLYTFPYKRSNISSECF